ncbi:MAG: hypothetical protein RQ761_07570, partial [Bacteroidales bacterium]|nr:hypothetical protein [Bacteroidales bacterium]
MKKQIQLLGGLMVFIALLTINSTAFADFVIKGGGTVVVMNGTSLTSNTNVTIESSGTLDNSGTVTLNANFTNNGIADLGTGSIVLSGTAMQEFGGSSVSEIDHLTVNNTGPGVTLSGSLRVDNSFTLTDGLVDMADYSLTLGPSISEVLGTPSVNNMIVTNGLGELRKEF